MNKIVNVIIREEKSISSIISSSLNINKEEAIETIKIFEYNINPVLKNWEKYSKYLLMGDVQSGKTNNLIYLSSKLFSSSKVDVIFYLTGTKNELLNQNQERFFKSFEQLGDNYQIYRNRDMDTNILENNFNKKIIINSLKTLYRLKELDNMINLNSPNINYLIIDDEADEGSTSHSTYLALQKITSKKNVKYVAITATPFKNLYKNQDFYDYFHIFKPGIGYQDLRHFNKSLKVFENKKQIVLIAFIEWIIKCSVYEIKNSQLLINFINLNTGHEKIYKFILRALNQLKQKQNLKKTISDNYPEFFRNIKKISTFINNLSSENFIINNGIEKEEPTNIGYEIIIGGLKLSRGITYRNLISEVMINMGKKTIDPGTLIQRARWLGYGKNIDIVDIYVNGVVKEALQEAEELIDMTKDFSLVDGQYKNIFNSMGYERLKLK